MILTAANTYAGGTTISGGTLQIGNGSTTGSIIGAVVDNGVLAFDRSDSLTFAGNISGSGSLVQMGGGTLTLSGTNPYSGGTIISGGIVSVASDSNLGTAGISLSNNAELLTTGAAFSSSKTLSLGTLGGTVAGATGTTATYSGAVSGSSVFNIGDATHTGTVILSGTNIYTAVTKVNAGTLQAGSLSAFSASSDFTVLTGATLNLNGFSNAIGSLAGGGTVTNTGTAAILTAGDTLNTTFSGTLQDGSVSDTLALTKTGTGTLTLSGTNTYTGTTTVTAGTLQAGSITALSGTSAFTVNSILDLHGFSNAIGSLAGSGTVTNTGLAATLNAGGNNTSTTFSGLLQDGAGALALTKVGTGTLILSGTNTYTGTTTLSGGILAVGNDNNLGSGALAFTGGTLETTGSLSSNKTVTLGPGGGTLLTDAGTISALSGPIIGAGPLTKTGTGTLTLSGTNSYTGTTTVSAGLLSVQGILSGSAVQVESGATLGGTGTINGAVTVTSGGTLAPGNSAVGTLRVGSLVLNAGSFSNFELSTPGVVGIGVNDLVTVTGNLTLGGTLNITDLGGFGAGVYRLFNDATLIDNGLTIGTVPGGVTRGALSIVTTPAGQVNLVVNGTNLLEYWDGSDPPTTAPWAVAPGPGTPPIPTGQSWTGVATRSGDRAWRCSKARPER